MTSRLPMEPIAASLWVCIFAGAAAAAPLEYSTLLSPIGTVLLTPPLGFAGIMPGATDPRSLTAGPLALPDIAAVLGVVLPEPIVPWSPGRPPPTLADVISVVSLVNWIPYDPLNPDNGWGDGQGSGIAEASAVWRAQMAAYLAQTAQSNAQQMTAFSAAVQEQFDIAMDPNRSPFDDLAISELVQDGGFITTEFQWGRGDMRHVESVFAKFRTSQSGFFGQ